VAGEWKHRVTRFSHQNRPDRNAQSQRTPPRGGVPRTQMLARSKSPGSLLVADHRRQVPHGLPRHARNGVSDRWRDSQADRFPQQAVGHQAPGALKRRRLAHPSFME